MVLEQFPTDVGRCTRMVTLVRMRRSAEQFVKVSLRGPENNVLKVAEFKDPKADERKIQETLSEFQRIAIANNPDAEFVDNHIIDVAVSGPEQVNVTLVDLPGFHNADQASSNMVNEMVKQYVSMSGTLVLHVVRGDTDFDSILANDFMRELPSGREQRITVLTHCDKLDAASRDDRDRLKSTLEKSAACRYPRCIAV